MPALRPGQQAFLKDDVLKDLREGRKAVLDQLEGSSEGQHVARREVECLEKVPPLFEEAIVEVADRAPVHLRSSSLEVPHDLLEEDHRFKGFSDATSLPMEN